jgi:hypothetical protein
MPSVEGHPDLAAEPFEHVRDHPRGRGLAVRAGDCDDRDPARRAGREQHVDDRLGDVLRLADRRVGVHPEPGRGVHLADRAAGLADRLGDVGADEVDPAMSRPIIRAASSAISTFSGCASKVRSIEMPPVDMFPVSVSLTISPDSGTPSSS